MARLACPYCGMMNFSISAYCSRCERALRPKKERPQVKAIIKRNQATPLATPTPAAAVLETITPRSSSKEVNPPPAPLLMPQKDSPASFVALQRPQGAQTTTSRQATPKNPEVLSADLPPIAPAVRAPVRPPALPSPPIIRRPSVAAAPPPLPTQPAPVVPIAIPIVQQQPALDDSENPTRQQQKPSQEFATESLLLYVPKLWQILLAMFIDTAVILCCCMLLSFILGRLLTQPPLTFPQDNGLLILARWLQHNPMMLPILLLWTSILALAYIYLGSVMGNTVGRSLLRLKLLKKNGQLLSTTQAFVRTLCAILSFFLMGSGFLWCLIDSHRRTWHDILSRCAIFYSPSFDEFNLSPQQGGKRTYGKLY